MSKFFKLYAPLYRNIPQTAELFSDSLSDSNVPQLAEQSKKRQQPVDDFKMLFSIPWDHHRRIIDKCKDDMDKALFFARKTWENNLFIVQEFHKSCSFQFSGNPIATISIFGYSSNRTFILLRKVFDGLIMFKRY